MNVTPDQPGWPREKLAPATWAPAAPLGDRGLRRAAGV